MIYLVNGTGANAARRPITAPAPTVHFGARLNSVYWTNEPPREERSHAAQEDTRHARP